MQEYVISGWSGWVVDGSGRYKRVSSGDTTTLRDDYVLSLAAVIDPVGSGNEVLLPVLGQADLDFDSAANWTAAFVDGFEFVSDGDVEISAYWNGSGGGTRAVTIEGSPGADLVLEPEAGEIVYSGRLSLSRFGTLVRIHFDTTTGVYLMAVRRGQV